MTSCPSCGHANIEGADHCEQCQADLSDAGSPQSTAQGLGQRFLKEPILNLNPEMNLTVGRQTPVAAVVRLMIDRHASGVMIVADGKLVGVFTERDCLMKIAGRYHELAEAPIEQFMTADPEVLQAGDSIAFGLNGMAVKSYRHLPIVKDGIPIAMVRTKDVLKYIARHIPQIA